ncbi:unnamed protein product [Lasius platythorax]|uniref:Uncharacterized protein n=1 Tax=Lasius platythorax TaxID=488582 RepID=A0AAV2NIN2_9HYME
MVNRLRRRGDTRMGWENLTTVERAGIVANRLRFRKLCRTVPVSSKRYAKRPEESISRLESADARCAKH